MRGRQDVIDMVAAYYGKQDLTFHNAPTTFIPPVEERMPVFIKCVLAFAVFSAILAI